MCVFGQSFADDYCPIHEEQMGALSQEEWEGIWHAHDDDSHDSISGEHFHVTHRDVVHGECVTAQMIGLHSVGISSLKKCLQHRS